MSDGLLASIHWYNCALLFCGRARQGRSSAGSSPPPPPPPRASFEQGGRGGRGFWTQNLVYQKWPDQIFPIVSFVFSHYGHFGLGRGGGGFGGGVPPPWFLIILKKPFPPLPPLQWCRVVERSPGPPLAPRSGTSGGSIPPPSVLPEAGVLRNFAAFSIDDHRVRSSVCSPAFRPAFSLITVRHWGLSREVLEGGEGGLGPKNLCTKNGPTRFPQW